MKASDYISDFFVKQGINHVFGYIGGMVAHLADSIYQNPNVEMVNSIQEQGAGFAAEGHARITGKTAVAIATSGPGATNLLTPLASCFFDSTPAVFITGQVNTFEYKKFPKIRQCGFQETNIVDMAKPITKYAVQINKIKDLRYELEKSFYLAQHKRKGPVLIDLPMDIQRMDFDFENAKSFVPVEENTTEPNELTEVMNSFYHAERPLVLVGHGVRLSGSTQRLIEFLDKTHIPVVESLMGRDCVPYAYPYNLGLIGTYGNRGANIALSMADVVLVLGSRLDVRQTGSNLEVFKDKKIIQVDIDDNELACDKLPKVKIRCDVRHFIEPICNIPFVSDISDWLQKVSSLKKRFPSEKEIDGTELQPNLIVSRIFEKLSDSDVICADVGQHQMWVGQSLKIKKETRVLFSGGLGSMGFALPAAIGASISGKRSVVIAGDGGFQMNLQELEIIKRRKLPVKIIVMNNCSLAMVRQFQDTYFNRRNPSTVKDYSVPDFAAIAQAYGIAGITKSASDISDDFLEDFFKDDTSALLNIIFDEPTTVSPKVLFGNTIDRMHPLLDEQTLNKMKE